MSSQIFNNWALKKWSLIFSSETRFDPNSYLLTSLVPLSYIKMVDGTNYVAVDLEEIKSHTPYALRGFQQLVKDGCAQWLEFTESPRTRGKELEDTSTGILAIGKLKGFKSVTYFMEETIPDVQEAYVENLKTTTSSGIASTMEEIDSLFVTYQDYCDLNGLQNKASQIYRKIKSLVSTAKSKKLTREEFLEYLYLINCIVFDWSDVPNVRGKHKELSTSTQIASKLTPEEQIMIVPYFVQNYHKFARKGSEETSIYNLSFNINTVLTKMRGNGVKNSKTSRDEDSL